MLKNGCMYTVCNSNLLFHASVPLNADGTLKDVLIDGKLYNGKAMLDKVGRLIRSAFNEDTNPEERLFARDYMWYLWCGKDAAPFDKDKMSTFERYFIKDKDLHKETKGYYYTLRNDEKVCNMLLDEFGVEGRHRHIINGHVPVKTLKGENPIKAGGKFDLRRVGKALGTSAPFLCYIIVVSLNLLHIRLPGPVIECAGIIANANAFMAMLMIGVGFRISANREQIGSMVRILSVRYAVSIILAFLCYFVLPFDLAVRQTLVILVFAPIGSAIPAFTAELGGDVGLSSAINSISIVISIVVIVTLLTIML